MNTRACKIEYILWSCLGIIMHLASGQWQSGDNCPIIPGGSYHIRNAVDDLCVSAIQGNGTGAIIEGIREIGNLTMNTCKNEPEQEWNFIANVNRKSRGNCTFHISSSKIHYGHIHKSGLFVNLTGNVMDYWPSSVQIFKNDKLKDMISEKCFQSGGSTLAPVLKNCEAGLTLQSWKFLLVNDPVHMLEQI